MLRRVETTFCLVRPVRAFDTYERGT